MSDERLNRFLDEARRLRYSRRTAIKRAGLLGLSVPAMAAAMPKPRWVAAQEKTTVNWFASRDATGFSPQQVEAFNAEHPSIEISYQEQGATTTDLHDKFVTIATARDSSADIVSMDVPFVPEFAAAGWTIAVEDLLPAEEREAFFAGTIEGATYDDQLYAVPWYNNGPGLFYRKDLLEGAGIAVPKSYDELLAASQELKTEEINGFIFQAAQTEGGMISWLEYLWGYGGELVDDEMNVILDEGSVGVDSMQRLVDFIYSDKISPESTLTMATGADAQNVFVDGRAVFLRLWMTSANAMEAEESKIKGMWDVTTLPSQDGASAGPGCLGTWNLGISAFSERQEEAAEVIRWFTSLDQQTARYLGNGNLPARSAVFEDAQVLETYAYVEQLKSAFEALKPRPVTPYYSQMSADALQPNFGAAITRQKEPDQAIADMAEAMRAVLGQ